MKTHTLGETELPVTQLGLGLAALGRPGYINLGHARDLQHTYDVPAMELHTHEVLDAAWEAGIRYFDAARSYGRAEQFLATWLSSRQIDVEDIAVGSKWGYTYTADWQVTADKHEVKEHSLPVLERQIRESRNLLGPYLDLYQIHSATLDSGVLENDDVLSELARLRDAGLLIGLSTSGPRQSEVIALATTIIFDGRPLFASVQATWNLLAQEAGPALEAAHAKGMGVIVKEALANGRLTSRNSEPRFARKRALLEQVASETNSTIDAVALAAALSQPWADIVLSGAANVDHLRSNIRAAEIDLGEHLALLCGELRAQPGTYWETRSQLAWN